ncbi:hypothetical protein NBRC116601_23150 [Cognatishimia sp. WU-CL00825]|uniref:hypothetical protein n=1 Tax=Cognatishimia sp. WU-CL00825 TaxID=3127658 RepID=UPI00310BBAE5
MTYENLILGVSAHLLFYEHLPHWGGWFNRLLNKLPKPLRDLYEMWRCPYCAGFWIGLALHALTGQWFLAGFANLPEYWGAAANPLGWFLDGLAFALCNKLGILMVNALGYPALLGYAKKQEFFASKAA